MCGLRKLGSDVGDLQIGDLAGALAAAAGNAEQRQVQPRVL